MSSEESKKTAGGFWTTLPGILTGVAAVITAIGSLIAVLYATDVLGPPKDPSSAPSGASWIVRLSNVDDHGYAYLNGKRILDCHVKQQPICETDITEILRAGTNTLRIEFVNDEWGWTYRYQLLRDGVIWAEEECGEAGRHGCKGDDQTTGTVFEKEIEIRP